MIALRAALTIAKTKPKSKADQKLAILNPGTMALAKRINKALIIKVNNPRLKTLIGKVKIRSIGRIKVLIRPKIRPATKAAKTPLTATPGKM